jgi:hypothetical protein
MRQRKIRCMNYEILVATEDYIFIDNHKFKTQPGDSCLDCAVYHQKRVPLEVCNYIPCVSHERTDGRCVVLVEDMGDGYY